MFIGRRALSLVLAGAVLCSGAGVATYQFLGNPSAAQGADKDKDEKKERHPRIHAAIQELKEARKDLKDADHDFGGHRKAAIESIDHSIEQLEKALKWAHEHDK
jgi:hypothetical protein